MSAVDDARILARLERLSAQADLSGVSLSAPSQEAVSRLVQAIRRTFGEQLEIRTRVQEGPAKLLSVEIERS